MSFSIEFADESNQYEARIKVVGVGGSRRATRSTR